MGGGIDEEILVYPTDRHYRSDCIVYVAVYGYRVPQEVAYLIQCLHLTPTITHPRNNTLIHPPHNISYFYPLARTFLIS